MLELELNTRTHIDAYMYYGKRQNRIREAVKEKRRAKTKKKKKQE